MAVPDLSAWPCEDIWQAIEPGLPGFTVEVLREIDSTNAELMRRARAGQTEPVLLVAEHQHAGRGRLGRQWIDQRVATGRTGSLMFSLGLALAPADWSGLSLAVGLSLAHSLHADIRLKWPNDLWWRDRKLAGVLVETLNWGGHPGGPQRYVVIGVGINIVCPSADGLHTAPAGLTDLLPDITASQALHYVAAPLVAAVQQFERRGFAPLQRAFNARDALAQVSVTLSDGTQGMARGVDTDGALLVATSSGLHRITSAEVSVRALHPPMAPHA
ncbi:MAG: biotin--[acetyl-CoA-carboxylase] ligase [Comamonadaceae bacterium CG1_02_60_18]|nr:MAG: biotin--[acetyl-CoA-carboxylase] ligase [Comamonadaceae bacterium CG1_02_60_18]PIQ53781.1 MAG: biotin--[acetyl-CoA-carboxylase] ligase [Comamonadaceae bacterium CG12_big_fil_rev_8_21_14_0_65_59_15]